MILLPEQDTPQVWRISDELPAQFDQSIISDDALVNPASPPSEKYDLTIVSDAAVDTAAEFAPHFGEITASYDGLACVMGLATDPDIQAAVSRFKDNHPSQAPLLDIIKNLNKKKGSFLGFGGESSLVPCPGQHLSGLALLRQATILDGPLKLVRMIDVAVDQVGNVFIFKYNPKTLAKNGQSISYYDHTNPHITKLLSDSLAHYTHEANALEKAFNIQPHQKNTVVISTADNMDYYTNTDGPGTFLGRASAKYDRPITVFLGPTMVEVKLPEGVLGINQDMYSINPGSLPAHLGEKGYGHLAQFADVTVLLTDYPGLSQYLKEQLGGSYGTHVSGPELTFMVPISNVGTYPMPASAKPKSYVPHPPLPMESIDMILRLPPTQIIDEPKLTGAEIQKRNKFALEKLKRDLRRTERRARRS